MDRRGRLASARVMYLFTPAASPGADPLGVLAAILPWIDAVQVRVKEPGAEVALARPTLQWTRRVVDVVRSAASEALVLVDDRVDVARVLADEGCDGVHLGHRDAPPRVAREVLGPEALIGLSTHDARQVVRAVEEPVDYLGFGPIHATPTKGYDRGLGAERAWIAAQASALPVFAIGGIDATNANELERTGRVAVCAALAGAADPARAAAALREALGSPV
jgi:thiamine-phosphate pyrophosphorylase